MQSSNTNAQMDQLDTAKKLLTLENQVRNGANWFFWIAALSIINSIIFNFGGGLTFVMGLGLTQIVDGFLFGLTQEISGNIVNILRIMGIFVNLLLAGVFVVFGYFAKKRIHWVLITGMVIYALDAAIVAIFGDWLGLAFHALALIGLSGGIRAMSQLAKLEDYRKSGDVAGIQTILNPTEDLALLEKKKQNFRRFSLVVIGLFGALVLFVIVMVFLFAR